MADPVKRVNYFDHQFLHADDFIDEQKYHIGMRQLHNRSLHTWGVAEGLDLSITSGKPEVTITRGMAVDQDGQEIWLTEDQPIDLTSHKTKRVYVTIAYGKKETEELTEGGVTGFTRVAETPDIQCTEKPPDKPGKTLILGRVTVDKNGYAGLSDEGEGDYKRRSAGVSAGDLEVHTLRLSTDLPPDKWPALSCSAANQVDLSGGLSVSGDADLGGTLTISGNVGIGTDKPQEALHVSGGSGSVNVLIEADVDDANEEDQPSLTFSQDAGKVIGQIGYFDGSNDLTVRNEFNAALHLGTNKKERLTISKDGNVGIGTTEPQGFQVVLPEGPRGMDRPGPGVTIAGGVDGNASIELRNSGSGTPYIDFAQNASTTDFDARIILAEPDKLSIQGANVGIGTTTPGVKLEVVGGGFRVKNDENVFQYNGAADVILRYPPRGSGGRALVHDNRNVLVLNYAGDFTGGCRYGVSLDKFSSRELKENIVDLSGAQAYHILEELNPVIFNLKADEEKRQHLGFIAEDAPDLIATDDKRAISNDHIVAILTKVVKGQQKVISDLIEKVKILEGQHSQ